MKVIELGAGSLQETVVVETLQSPQDLLGTARNEPEDLRGTEKAVPMNPAEDFAVAISEAKGRDFSRPFEAGKAGGFHPAILPRREIVGNDG